uniref:Uncharacterized protein n=1 Tax=Chromera velia CCMP2878 TaxID=1169474 RepID=A0A0G4HU54_9ALVE|eukprot:Cvel_8605.t1-p1 / transcript=Cvel_8605.t1 / gene=Cvel_8605 / organism=Chromera_velia_CCMP2878 / gene_product=hypothetical protein / transcript_product=hypothetical protein / location=Cvel_scaffold478:5334-5925(-) / protein_length=155 / sequence_SO=supercontig / SO=protein_coding / is_pseudo=false
MSQENPAASEGGFAAPDPLPPQHDGRSGSSHSLDPVPPSTIGRAQRGSALQPEAPRRGGPVELSTTLTCSLVQITTSQAMAASGREVHVPPFLLQALLPDRGREGADLWVLLAVFVTGAKAGSTEHSSKRSCCGFVGDVPKAFVWYVKTLAPLQS